MTWSTTRSENPLISMQESVRASCNFRVQRCHGRLGWQFAARLSDILVVKLGPTPVHASSDDCVDEQLASLRNN